MSIKFVASEVGYTPKNLRDLIEFLGWTQLKVALFFDVSEVTVRRWLMPLGVKNHRDMPSERFAILLLQKSSKAP